MYSKCVAMTSTRPLEGTCKNEKLKLKIYAHHSKFTFDVTDIQNALWRLTG